MDKLIIPTIGVLVIKDKKVLLVRHGLKADHIDGKIGLPAGRPIVGESEVDAACRELLEETGLSVRPGDLTKLPITWYADIERKDGTKTFSLVVFAGQLQGNEEAQPMWVDIRELDAYDLLPNVRDIIDEGLKL